jgi:hypothetical protein
VIPFLVDCALLLVMVTGCDARAAVYDTAARTLPPQHWALVRSVTIEPGHGKHKDGAIRLPPYRGPRVLWHEAGHAVGDATGLIDDYCAEFWRRGRPLGAVARSYGKTNCREDWATAYERTVRERWGSARERWMLRRMPELLGVQR